MKTVDDIHLFPNGPQDPPSTRPYEETDMRNQRGLCSICEDCEVCTFPKPEGGVWHCEEYR